MIKIFIKLTVEAHKLYWHTSRYWYVCSIMASLFMWACFFEGEIFAGIIWIVVQAVCGYEMRKDVTDMQQAYSSINDSYPNIAEAIFKNRSR